MLSRMNISISLSNNLQLKPILIAVSTLSPVRTQSFIPAYFMKSIVGPTSSYNLSSIALEPTKVKSISILSATLSIASSRFFV